MEQNFYEVNEWRSGTHKGKPAKKKVKVTESLSRMEDGLPSLEGDERIVQTSIIKNRAQRLAQLEGETRMRVYRASNSNGTEHSNGNHLPTAHYDFYSAVSRKKINPQRAHPRGTLRGGIGNNPVMQPLFPSIHDTTAQETSHYRYEDEDENEDARFEEYSAIAEELWERVAKLVNA